MFVCKENNVLCQRPQKHNNGIWVLNLQKGACATLSVSRTVLDSQKSTSKNLLVIFL